mgnify:CR=1 FL=1
MSALSHLDNLEAEAIYIIREVAAECEKPVMLYSIGKDSSVMLHLALKAFYPEKPPFPFLHVNTTWKFKEMIRFRDETMKKYGLQLIEHINQEGVKQGVNPFDYGASYTDIMKTQALKQALNQYGFTAASAAAGATKKSPAPRNVSSPSATKPRLGIRRISVRKCGNCTTRIFIRGKVCEYSQFPTGQKRISGSTSSGKTSTSFPCILLRNGPASTAMATSSWSTTTACASNPVKKSCIKKIRFRTLGCYPLTGGIESDADTLDASSMKP